MNHHTNNPPPLDIPQAVLRIARDKGLVSDDIIAYTETDMDTDYTRRETLLLATQEELLVISGIRIIHRKKNVSAFTTRRLCSDFQETNSTHYCFADYADFRAESLITSVRLTAKRKNDGFYHLLACGSNTYKDELCDFAETVRRTQEKSGQSAEAPDQSVPHPGDPHGAPPTGGKAEKKEKFCPKCGMRYANPERKICPRCMDKSKIIRRTGEFILKYKASIILLMIMLTISGALSIFTPYLSSGFFFDEVLNENGRFYGQLLLVLGMIVTTKLLSMLFSMLQNIVSSVIAAKLSYDLKKTIFSAIERLSIRFFTNRQTGGLMTQVTGDANTIYWFFCEGVPYFLLNIVQVTAILIIMFIINPLLSAVVVIAIPIDAVLIKFIFKRLDRMHYKRFATARAMRSLLSDVLSGIRVVKAFARESQEGERFNARSAAKAEADRKASMYNNCVFPWLGLLAFVSTNLAVLGIGGWMVIGGTLSYGMLLTFIAYAGLVYNPIMFFIDMTYMTSDSMNAMNRLIEIMDAEPDVKESAHPVTLGEVTGQVEFRHVDFSYEKSRKIIDDVSFTIEAGKMIGIVGHTGAGKSTIANLLIRLYDVDRGEILIDGVNVRDIAFADLRRNVAIVSQETYFFMDTILENIRYAKPDATYEEVVRAAKISGAHDFIIKLPDAYATRIGFGQKELSGGEKQRVSIARAILRDPKILILDEATAAMDTETERKIQDAIERLVAGRTTIMIAHRLSTLRNADRLIVIENGRIPESGTHLELLSKKGIYHKLYQLQTDALKNIGIEEN